MVAALGHRDVAAGPAQDDAALDARGGGHRLVGGPLQRHRGAAAPGLVLGDQHLAAHVLEPPAERVGREAAEDDGVRGPDARAGEHRDGRLRDHAHVDPDRGSLLHAERLERVRELRRLALEVCERDLAAVVDRLALPVVGDPVAVPGLDVAVDAVVGDVELPADEPLRVRQLPLADGLERLEPRHALAGLVRPELERLAVVDVGLRVRCRGELGRRRIPPLLEQHRLDRALWLLGQGALTLAVRRPRDQVDDADPHPFELRLVGIEARLGPILLLVRV